MNQTPQQPFPYREEAVTFVSPKAAVTLVGILTLPQGKGPFPAVLIVVGADRNDRDESFAPDHHPFLVVADALTRRGIAVLRYDKRGVGESGGNFDAATTKDFEEDALNGIEYLKKRVEIDPRKIGIVGHSEGGMIACLAAVDSRNVSFIVLMAAIGVPWDEAVLHANTEVLRKEGVHKEVVSVLTRVGHAVIEEIRNEKNNAKALDKANEIIKSGKESLKEEDWEKYEALCVSLNETVALHVISV